MRAVTEMRAVIEGFAARYAAMRVASGTKPTELLATFSAMQKTAQAADYDEFMQIDRRLHLAIVKLAEVPGLSEVWLHIAQRQRRFHVESIRACWPDLNVLFEAHRALVDAVCSANEVAAEDASRAHLDAVWYRLAELTGDPSLPNDPLARACTYMMFHLQEPVRLEFLAEYVAKTSPGHLSRLFRQEHGMNFTEYLRDLRMRKAVALLLRSHQPIKRIAEQVGYLDGSRFARHFAQHFGLTPLAYRKQFGQASDIEHQRMGE